MEIPTYSSDKRRHMKFSETSVPVSFRLPKSMAQRIKDENWDLGQFVFNILKMGQIPSISDDTQHNLIEKLIGLMMNEDIVAPEGFFTPAETGTIMQIAERLRNGS